MNGQSTSSCDGGEGVWNGFSIYIRRREGGRGRICVSKSGGGKG